jgi:hypothetical protein
MAQEQFLGRIVDKADNEAKWHILEHSDRRGRRGGRRRDGMADRGRRGRRCIVVSEADDDAKWHIRAGTANEEADDVTKRRIVAGET